MSSFSEIVDVQNVKQNLIAMTKEQIRCALTWGREDNDLVPFTENQIDDFIADNLRDINAMVEKIIKEYEEMYIEDGNVDDLEEITKPEGGLIREYLYNCVPSLLNAIDLVI